MIFSELTEVERKQLKSWLTNLLLIWVIFLELGLLFQFWDLGAEAGQWGDFFGSVNSLLSALAVFGAVCAVVLQMRELKETRDELTQSRRAQQDGAREQARMASFQYWSASLEFLQHELAHRRSRKVSVLKLRAKIKKYCYGVVRDDNFDIYTLLAILAEAESERIIEYKFDDDAPILHQIKSNELEEAKEGLFERFEAALSRIDEKLSKYDEEIIELKGRRKDASQAISLLDKERPSASETPRPPTSGPAVPSSR